MYDISQKTPTYSEVLQKENDVSIFTLFFCLLAFAGMVLLLIVWRKYIKEDELSADSTQKSKKVKKEKVEWIVALISVPLVIIGGTITSVIDLSETIYDIKTNAYVVVENDFEIKSQVYGFGRWADEPVYTLVYEQDGKQIEVDIVTKYCEITEGKYTDTILVYSARSHILLEVTSTEGRFSCVV